MSQIVDCINNLDALPAMDAECVDAIVTDPPYGLGFMGKAWDKALPDPRTWVECLRVLKPGGHAVIFGAPRLYHRLACAVEDAGFEVRDVLMWLFGSGFPKSLDVSKAIDKHQGATRKRGGQIGRSGQARSAMAGGFAGAYYASSPATPEAAAWAGWGTALKPAYEPILLVRKPMSGTVAQNVLTHGTGGINVDACRAEGAYQTRDRRTDGGASMFGTGAGDGAFVDAAGRWPANVVMDTHEGEDWRRYFYCAKASRSEREAGLAHLPARVVDESRAQGSAGRESPRAGAGRKGGGRANRHPTVKPIALMEWLVRLVTPPGGLVLDPFCGSGSTGVACARMGVRFLGLELDPEHVEVARARIAHARKS